MSIKAFSFVWGTWYLLFPIPSRITGFYMVLLSSQVRFFAFSMVSCAHFCFKAKLENKAQRRLCLSSVIRAEANLKRWQWVHVLHNSMKDSFPYLPWVLYVLHLRHASVVPIKNNYYCRKEYFFVLDNILCNHDLCKRKKNLGKDSKIGSSYI